MTTPNFPRDSAERREASDGRRLQLRALLLSAADAARQGRRVHKPPRVSNPIGLALRDRIATLFNEAE